MSLSKPNLDKTKKYLIAVSGGADSMALLDMLRVQNYQLIVAHVNYKSRPTSDRDEQIVVAYCKKYQIEYYSTIAIHDDKSNFEKWAREARYNFFKKIYEKENLDGLLIAHHKDDVIETYLMKKERKSLGYDLTIPRNSFYYNMNIIRPLYELSKEELRNYCLDNNVEFGDDETNFEPIYARNKLRIEKLSKMSQEEKNNLFNKIIVENKEWNDKLNKILSLYRNLESLTFSKLTSLDIDSQVLILYDYIASNLKDASLNEKLSRKRLLDMLEKLKRNPNVSIKLKDDVHLVKEYEKLWIKSGEFENYLYVLESYEKLITPYFEISLNGKNMEGVAVLKEDFPLTIRPYKSDDYIEIKDGHKSVRRLYIDKKIPMSLRKTLPILFNKEGKILLIPSLYKEVKRKSLQSNFFMIKYHKY